MKIDILAIGAHPDDVEISACGTILRHIAMGRSVAILDLTRGELGTRGNAELRDREAKHASELLGISNRINLGLGDGFFEVSEENKLKVVEAIRFFQPEIVLTTAPFDRHPDHGRACKLARTACFLSALPKVKTTFKGSEQQAWKPKAVYSYVQDRFIDPDFVIDISDYAERKIEILKAYKSQFFDPTSSEPETPIAREDFFDFLRGRWAQFGRLIGVKYAEGFVTERALGVKNLSDLI